jgi:hypothetical protein
MIIRNTDGDDRVHDRRNNDMKRKWTRGMWRHATLSSRNLSSSIFRITFSAPGQGELLYYASNASKIGRRLTLTILAHWVPFPAPGPPNTNTTCHAHLSNKARVPARQRVPGTLWPQMPHIDSLTNRRPDSWVSRCSYTVTLTACAYAHFKPL